MADTKDRDAPFVIEGTLTGATVRGFTNETEALASLKDRNERAEAYGIECRYRMRAAA